MRNDQKGSTYGVGPAKKMAMPGKGPSRPATAPMHGPKGKTTGAHSSGPFRKSK